MKLSVVIPSYKDPLINKTVESILQTSELGDQLEIICVLDGYWQEIVGDPRVKVVHLGENRGMRGAINAGVAVAKGEFLMRTDEHCMFDQGFDKKMTDVCKPNWIMTAKRYFLDTEKWEVMDREPVEYEELHIQKVGEKKKFCGISRPAPSNKKVLETQAMQGSCWVMPHKWWDKVIGELQVKGYGPHYQDSHEMVFKTWKAGGKLMMNRNTWYAHKHYKFPRSHNYGSQNSDPHIEYCYKKWFKFYKQWKRSQ